MKDGSALLGFWAGVGALRRFTIVYTQNLPLILPMFDVQRIVNGVFWLKGFDFGIRGGIVVT